MIDQATVQRILDIAEITEVVGEFVTLKRRGTSLLGLCPFHNEKTPSFNVSPAKGIYKCFGCGKGGSAVNFIMEHEHLSFVESLRWLAKKYHIEVVEKEERPEDIQERNDHESQIIVSEFAQKYFAAQLWETEYGRAVGLSYFHERGFRDEILRKFGLGYCPDGKDPFTQSALKEGYKMEFLEKTGLTIKRDDWIRDRFAGRVMFPIHSISGRVIAFGGRTLSQEKSIAKYLNSPETVLFSKRRTLYGLHEALPHIRKSGRLLLLEGYMDVIGAHQHGVDWAVAPLGTALTAEHAGLVGRYAKDVVVMFDGDRAGIAASVRAAEIFMEAGLYVRLADLGCTLDPDEFLNEHGREKFEAKIAEAADPLEFRMNLFHKGRKTPPSSQEKAQAIAVLLETVAKQSDEILKSEWVKSLASRFGVEEDSVLKQLRKTQVAPQRGIKRAPAQAVQMPSIERGFIQLLLRDPSLIERSAELDPGDLSSPLARDILAAMRELPAEARPKAAAAIAGKFPEQAALIMELAVADLGSDAAGVQNAEGAVRMLKRLSIKRRLTELNSSAVMTPQQLEEFRKLSAEIKSSGREI